MSSSTATDDSGAMLVLGEIHTSLLMNSSELDGVNIDRLLRVVPGQQVRMTRHPLDRAVSPELLTGVDCLLANSAAKQVRAIGTVQARAVVTGGRILQGSARTIIVSAAEARRMPWDHYLARPGYTELLTRYSHDSLAEGFLSSSVPPESLNPGAVAEQLVDLIQLSDDLDKHVTLRARPHRVRWAAILDDMVPRSADIFVEEDETFRTIRLKTGSADLDVAIRFCEDLALHDWLLTSLSVILTKAGYSSGSAESLGTLRTALDQLVHLWMPATGKNPVMHMLWEGLERHAGYTRQWDTMVRRLRDQIALRTSQ